MTRAAAVYRALLHCYPSAFRQEYGSEMLLAFDEQIREARLGGARLREAAVWFRAALDAVTVAPQEHWFMILQDVRYALRNMAASPGFAAVAILSLALGIGANTAIFSLWNGVLLSTLPVPEPERLVILTDPDSSGVSIGSQTGERTLMSYAEFEQLRDRTTSFSSLMSSQSSLDQWQVRSESGGWEEANGRLVSGDYFRVLGVTPLLGRPFAPSDDHGPAPYTIISYDYWQRRFGGNPGVLGRSITVRKAALTIIGVTGRDFIGETSGQRPDLWVPMSMQAGVLPGRDWLHDVGQDKVMWLHVFGRLKPGVTIAQAQAEANTIFKAGIQTYYGAVASPQAQKQFLDQTLKLRPASGGASEVRDRLSSPLRILLVAVGLVLLIACANIANLLLARGAARQREIALRLSLGASRGRLIRQLVTESMVLALCGGLAGLAVAYALHRLLVGLITGAVDNFEIGFTLEPRVLGFSLAATLLSALFFGLLPAWLATRASAGSIFRSQDRGATGSSGQLRWGRILVAGQLALSLPLLVGAGLLLRTLYNLQLADLGYSRERLVVVRIDAESAGYAMARREPLFSDLIGRIRRIPGVRAASYSENGIFSGRDSGDQIEVEGFHPTGDKGRGSRWDQVGPGYFSTLGVPMLMGREINDGDQAGSPKVCVINAAFAKLFFAGRNPIGMRVTGIYGDSRKDHYVVGVARDAHTGRIRGEVEPRYYVPLTQPNADMDGVVFEVRSASDPGPVLAAVQQVIRNADPTLPMTQTGTVEERIDKRMAQDRMIARLTVAFGITALLLAAIGLYGVLSYGTARRRGEIGIRIALGAEPRRVVRMVLRETATMIVLGLVVGAGLAYGAARLVTSMLFGLAPHDPATLTAAVTILLLVSLVAAYLPARRASRLDPMAALRQE